MARGPRKLNLKRARVLISNDDGINAPGLKALERAAKAMFHDVWVVAPETEQSATSHSLTLRRPLRIRKVSKQRYAVDGTPTDSVLLGINEVMSEFRPDLVLSGINRGGNLGEDVIYSGTVAAAMEGCMLGVPAVALSQVCQDRTNVHWPTAETWMPRVLRKLAATPWPVDVVMNVNFPDVTAKGVTGIEVCRQGKRKIGDELVRNIDPRGDAYYWLGPQRDEEHHRKGTDLEAVGRGAIAVTPLGVDSTHEGMLKKLRAALR